MPPEMKQSALDTIKEAFDNHPKEEKIANEIKSVFDKTWQPSWNVIVGKNFGSHVINQTQCYLFCSLNDDEIFVLMWKS